MALSQCGRWKINLTMRKGWCRRKSFDAFVLTGKPMDSRGWLSFVCLPVYRNLFQDQRMLKGSSFTEAAPLSCNSARIDNFSPSNSSQIDLLLLASLRCMMGPNTEPTASLFPFSVPVFVLLFALMRRPRTSTCGRHFEQLKSIMKALLFPLKGRF